MSGIPKIQIFLLFLWLVWTSCNKAAHEPDRGTFYVHGKLANKTSGQIFLSTIDDDQPAVRDSASIKADGSFELEGALTGAHIGRLSIGGKDGLLLVIDTPEIEVTADARDLPGTGVISGSEESALLQSLTRSAKKNLDEQSHLEKQFAIAQMTDKPDSLLYYQERFVALQSENARMIKNFIRKNPGSFVATYAASTMLNREEEGAFLDSVLIAFNENIPDSKYLLELNEWAKKSIRISPGSFAPDINLPQTDGTLLALSSLKGEYVLVDFWASWCGPCRKENPRVVKLYNQYKNKGFEIYGVSLDESEDQWLTAIEKDRLPWRQVCDLKGAGSAVVQLYDVRTIPMTVLLDKEGKILALNLRGASLGEKLRELFGE